MAKLTPTIKEIEQEFNAKYFQMSAYTGDGVNEAFDFLFKELYKAYRSDETPNDKPKPAGFGLSSKPVSLKDKKEKKCC
jgi:hypothetical protein